MKTAVYLIDNGSLRPEATLGLRRLARALSERTGRRVEPVSLLHAHKVDPAALGGEAATIVRRRLKESIAAGIERVVFLPLFLGPSRAITEYLPELVEEARVIRPNLQTVVADPLAGPEVDRPDPRLASILADQVRDAMQRYGMSAPKIAVVDHGSPVEVVTRVRNAVAEQLRDLLGSEVAAVQASSMERRDGPEYAFNKPLLERIDQVGAFQGGDLLAALFFLLPGRHAGPGGDVAEILEGLREQKLFDRVAMTDVLAEHPGLTAILEDRLKSALSVEGKAVDSR